MRGRGPNGFRECVPFARCRAGDETSSSSGCTRSQRFHQPILPRLPNCGDDLIIDRRSVMWSLLVSMVFWFGPAAIADTALHDRSYWEAIIRTGYTVPSDQTPFVLARELSGLLGSPDPELRDQIAFSILGVWLGGDAQFSDPELV